MATISTFKIANEFLKDRQFDAVLAFPGIGKSTLSKTGGNVVDLDYGILYDMIKNNDIYGGANLTGKTLLVDGFRQLYKSFHLKSTILVNVPELLEGLPYHNLLVVIPTIRIKQAYIEKWFKRTQTSSNYEKFVALLRQNYEIWLSSWADFANSNEGVTLVELDSPELMLVDLVKNKNLVSLNTKTLPTNIYKVTNKIKSSFIPLESMLSIRVK